jgi:hypothetical protein
MPSAYGTVRQSASVHAPVSAVALLCVMTSTAPLATAQQPAPPVPAPGAPHAYSNSPFSVDTSKPFTINYVVGPFTNNKLPIGSGSGSKDSQLIINAPGAWGIMPETAHVDLSFTFGKSSVVFAPPMSIVLKWDPENKQYSTKSPDDSINAVAAWVIDQINGMENDFNANNPVPSVFANLKIRPHPAGADPKKLVTTAVDHPFRIAFQQVTSSPAPVKPAGVPSVAPQQLDVAVKQLAVAEKQLAASVEAVELGQRQFDAAKTQYDVALQQFNTLRQQNAAPPVLIGAQTQADLAQQQAERIQRQVAIAQRQADLAQQQATFAKQQATYAQTAVHVK